MNDRDYNENIFQYNSMRMWDAQKAIVSELIFKHSWVLNQSMEDDLSYWALSKGNSSDVVQMIIANDLATIWCSNWFDFFFSSNV